MLRSISICSVLLLSALIPAWGQRTTVPPSFTADSLFRRAMLAYETDRLEQAVEDLEALVSAHPVYVNAARGSAYLWLGRAYAATDRGDDAQDAWRKGWQTFLSQDLIESLLADAFVRSTFGGKYPDDIQTASDAYVRLLESMDWLDVSTARPVLEEHVRELMPILPADLIAALELESFLAGGMAADGMGARLATWWRGNDVAPATRRNERLEEHLARVAVARRRFMFRDELDVRGNLYVRLGPPARSTSVDFLSTSFRNEVIDRSLTAMVSDFPDNELWVYEHIDKDAFYIFYKQGSRWREGEVRDLIPPQLMAGIGGTSRGLSKSKAVIRTLEVIYEYLSMQHVAFATRYQEVFTYASMLDEQEMLEDMAQRRRGERQVEVSGDSDLSTEVGDVLARGGSSGPSAGLSGGIASPSRPDLFAYRSLSTAHSDDQYMFARRDAVLPRSYSNVFDPVDRVEMPSRAARFLDDNGTTRTEVYWGIPPGALTPSRRTRRQLRREGIETDDYVLSETLVQKDARYIEQRIHHRRLSVPNVGQDRNAAIAPRTIVAVGDTGQYHLAAQWTMYPVVVNEKGRAEAVNRQVRTFLARFDSLDALSADPSRLEMSDLKPVVLLQGEEAMLSAEVAADAQAHPYPVLSGGSQLVLYFEVYHLRPDVSGYSRFDVEYVVNEPGEREEGTISRSSYRIAGSTAREAVLVDLAEWRGSGEVRITLRIEERSTGRTISRSVEIRLED